MSGHKWQFYNEGVLGPCDESVIREFCARFGLVMSDERGVANMVMKQLWGEIDALRHDIERHMAIASREAEARCKMEDALRKMVEALEDDGEHTRMGSRDQCDVCDAMAAAQALLEPAR